MSSSNWPKRAAHAPRGVVRFVDAAVIAVIVLSVAFLAWRVRNHFSPDLIPTHRRADAVFGVIGAAFIALLVPWGRNPRKFARGVAYLGALLLVGMVVSRLALLRMERSFPHPLAAAAHTMGDGSGEMIEPALDHKPTDAAEWAVRVALHVGIDSAGALLPIPDGWALPPGVSLGVEPRAKGGWEIWAQYAAASAIATCHARVDVDGDDVTGAELTPRCASNATLPTGVVLAPPPRGAAADPIVTPGPAGASWLQHRGNARREAVLASQDSAGPGWRTSTHTAVRTGASASGDLVLIGGHGTGLLTALDRRTGARRWSARAPNWIHQDPVSDGRIVVVGFGDSDRSFLARAPSGVAAFDLVTGRRLWTEFEERSVMTSPTILDSVVVYVSADGTLRKRLLATGKLLGTMTLPGAVIMGPPVRTGDTLVVTLEHYHTCAVAVSTLQTLWCRELRDLRMLGHGSAAIDDGVVVVSGVATALTPGLGEFLRLPVGLQANLLGKLLFPSYRDEGAGAGQILFALDLATGAVMWRSSLFPERRTVEGHSAGTAAIQDGLGVVILPIADTVLAFAPKTGAIVWGGQAHASRGPPLILGDQVIIAGRDGVIELRQLKDGVLRCTLRRDVGSDRAGPIAVGGLVIFANLDGEVEAIPASALLGCTATGASRPAPTP